MSEYELVVILNPELTDEGISSFVDRLKGFVNGVGGNVKDTTAWGKRKLAYPIKRCSEGNYILAKLELHRTATKELESNLKMWDGVLRHLLVRVNA